MLENDLIRYLKLISKFMTSQPKKQTIAIQMLSNISKSKGNQKMMFGKLIEYNVNITFVHGVSRKMFLMLYSINGPNFIV